MIIFLKCLALNPAHVSFLGVNTPMCGEFCFTVIARYDIEGSESDLALNAWPPQGRSRKFGLIDEDS